MENNKKKLLKKSEKSKDKTLIQKITNIDGKLLSILKQNWDKIENEYVSLMKKFEKFETIIKEPEIKKEFKTLISSISNFKSNFKSIFFNVGINMANLSNNTSEKINYSYDNIYNEMTDLDLVINDINEIQNNNRKNKKMKIQKLENKLHEFMDEVENFDFNKLEKTYDICNSYNNNELEKILLQNNFIEKYNIKEADYNDENFENNLLDINQLRDALQNEPHQHIKQQLVMP